MKLITEMFAGVEGATDAVVQKATTLVEAHVELQVQERLQSEVARLDEQFDSRVEDFITEKTEQVNAFLDAAINEWAKTNAVAIDSNIKAEISVGLVKTLKEAFEATGFVLPEADAEGKLNEAHAQAAELQARLDESQALLKEAQDVVLMTQRNTIIAEATKGLADTTRDKVVMVCESIEFVSADAFAEKVKTIAEAFTPKGEDDKGKNKEGEDDKAPKGEPAGEDDKGKQNLNENSIQSQTLAFLRG